MSVSNPGIFSHSVFSGGAVPQTNQKAAAAGFSQIFTTMLAKQMRESMVGADAGPMGIGGGATGDIYGSFIDEALGNALAKSKSMSQLNKMIGRELAGPRHSVSPSTASRSSTASELVRNSSLSGAASSTAKLLPFNTGVTMTNDARGPVLLPPAPAGAASVLLPPPSEG